ncbi:MAG: N-acetylmuramoyl-L-alanine amidase [Bacteroidales bacterium]|nr:N-acetylmuramoyl-L-alanine amidase [Bacteroidales bacterium]MBN2762912.1 N-acetylmuramoyl-L-alanine amidase [Bacteroidales bacterium]
MIKTTIRIVIKRGICIFLVSWFIYHGISGQTEAVNGYKLKTVVIDAGHGGKDPGSVGKKGTEKEVVLAIALKLGKYIEEKLPDVKVIYTRKTDEFIPLHKRADIANSHKADLYISIHANGNENHLVDGTETLVLGLHRAEENFEVAKKENSVILLEDDYTTHYEGFDPNSPESYMIFSLMQNLYFEQSINFAAYVQDQFRNRAVRKDRGVKQQGLLVLARTSMPGVLIETGFMTNPEEEEYLMSDKGQDLIASAIFRAFRDYKHMMENKKLYFAGEFNAADSDDFNPSSDTLALAQWIVIPVENADSGKAGQDIDTTKDKIAFKVQVLASMRKVPVNDPQFKGYKEIEEYRVGKMYKYALNGGSSFKETIAYCKQLQAPFPGAFVIAVKDKNIIPLDQALKEINLTTNNN